MSANIREMILGVFFNYTGHHVASWLHPDACADAGVNCFVKQDSGLKSGMQGRIPDDLWEVQEYPCVG